MQEVEEQKADPEFAEILMSGEKLASEVSENFFRQGAPDKPSADSFSESFKNTIFNETGLGNSEIMKTYHTLVSTLR